jgi:hypothetical protein
MAVSAPSGCSALKGRYPNIGRSEPLVAPTYVIERVEWDNKSLRSPVVRERLDLFVVFDNKSGEHKLLF